MNFHPCPVNSGPLSATTFRHKGYCTLKATCSSAFGCLGTPNTCDFNRVGNRVDHPESPDFYLEPRDLMCPMANEIYVNHFLRNGRHCRWGELAVFRT
eukprot:scaffold8204_cov177-Amphora_coffeaeformis.AAC.6